MCEKGRIIVFYRTKGYKLFIKNAMKLVTGTVAAQLLPFFVLPFLTRSMGGEAFGLFSLFFTTVMMLGALSTLRFDYALNAVKNSVQAIAMLKLCIILSLAALIIIFVFVFFAHSLGYLSSIWFLLPFTVGLMSINQSYYMYANFSGDFGLMSRSKIINAVVCSALQLSLVYIADFQEGAYWGMLIGLFISTYYLYSKLPIFSKIVSSKRLVFIFKRYKVYPRLVFPGTLINFISGNLPLYVIGFLFGPVQAGYYSLAIRVAGVPTSIVGRSIGEVFREKASRELKGGRDFFDVFIKISVSGFCVAVLGFVILFFIANPLFEFVFGTGWATSVLYLKILVPVFILQFSAATVGYSLMLLNWQRQEFDWQILRLVLMMVGMLSMYIYSNEVTAYVIAASISLIVSFSVYMYMCFKCVSVGRVLN